MGRETGFCFRDNRGLLGSKKDRAGKGHRTLRKHGTGVTLRRLGWASRLSFPDFPR